MVFDPSENSGSLVTSGAAVPLRIVSPVTPSSDSARATFMARKVPVPPRFRGPSDIGMT